MAPQDIDQSQWYTEHIKPHKNMLLCWLQGRFALDGLEEDVIQEAFLRAIKARDRGVLHSPKAFLFKTARNLAIDLLRKKNRVTEEPLANLEPSNVIWLSDSVPEMVSRNQEYAILNQAIASLPEKCREIFTMRRIYGMSQMEISDALGISRNTVSAQLTIGLKKCSEYFDRFNQEGDRSSVGG